MFNNYIIGNSTTGSHVSYSTSPFRVIPSSYSHLVGIPGQTLIAATSKLASFKIRPYL